APPGARDARPRPPKRPQRGPAAPARPPAPAQGAAPPPPMAVAPPPPAQPVVIAAAPVAAAPAPASAIPPAPAIRGITDSEIRFGIAAPLSGPAKELGRQMKLGLDTAFGAINDAGGVQGRALRLAPLDDGYEPSR